MQIKTCKNFLNFPLDNFSSHWQSNLFLRKNAACYTLSEHYFRSPLNDHIHKYTDSYCRKKYIKLQENIIGRKRYKEFQESLQSSFQLSVHWLQVFKSLFSCNSMANFTAIRNCISFNYPWRRMSNIWIDREGAKLDPLKKQRQLQNEQFSPFSTRLSTVFTGHQRHILISKKMQYF